MATVKKPYGPWSQEMLEAVRGAGVLKVEAFVEWLYNHGIQVDRTLVSHWCAGRSHLPADVLPLLAEFTERPDLVFGNFLRQVRCDVFRIPEGRADGAALTDLLLETGAALGRLQHGLFEARSPDSPGGVAVTTEERDSLRGRVDEMIQHLAEVRANLGKKGRKST